MELFGTFVRETINIGCYGMILIAVYKLFGVASDLAEIKELLKRGHTFAAAPRSANESRGDDAYAADLLKTLRPETSRE